MFLFCLAGTLITEYERRRLKTMLEFCTEKHRRRRLQRNIILSNMMEEEEEQSAGKGRQQRTQGYRQAIHKNIVISFMGHVLCFMLYYSSEDNSQFMNLFTDNGSKINSDCTFIQLTLKHYTFYASSFVVIDLPYQTLETGLYLTVLSRKKPTEDPV